MTTTTPPTDTLRQLRAALIDRSHYLFIFDPECEPLAGFLVHGLQEREGVTPDRLLMLSVSWLWSDVGTRHRLVIIAVPKPLFPRPSLSGFLWVAGTSLADPEAEDGPQDLFVVAADPIPAAAWLACLRAGSLHPTGDPANN